MKKTIQSILILLPLLLLFIPKSNAAQWHYPMNKYYARQTIKGFGQYINDDFYKGKENLFPHNRFYGYHAAVDLEALSGEENKNTSIYAVSSGTITYIGTLPGYGGVILQSIEGVNTTALYGHIKVKKLTIKVGDEVVSGQAITILGKGFSDETSGERKHLHFGIYKGTDLYFRGHEESQSELVAKWENPNNYLKLKGALLIENQFSKDTKKKTTLGNPNPMHKQPFNLYTFVKALINSIFAKLK